jgi:hypothetical protein
MQEPDGSWVRAYTLAGEPITEPIGWFGQTEVQQKSSTATPVAFLASLYELTSDPRLLEAARRAGEFARVRFLERIRFNGGIHDSIYAKPQLVNGESILFSMQALQHLYRVAKNPDHLEAAIRASHGFVCGMCLFRRNRLWRGSTFDRRGGWPAMRQERDIFTRWARWPSPTWSSSD